MGSELLVLDADGVLLDYHEGYARAWTRAFGYRPAVRNPHGYHPIDYWEVPTLSRSQLEHLRIHGFASQTWRDMPAIPGALEACQALQRAGFRLVCVSALAPEHEAARAQNLRALGFDLDAVHAVGAAGLGNPKQRLLTQLQPAAFVDDYLGYLQNLPPAIHRALIEGRAFNNPNRDPQFEAPDSRHGSLSAFVDYWLAQP